MPGWEIHALTLSSSFGGLEQIDRSLLRVYGIAAPCIALISPTGGRTRFSVEAPSKTIGPKGPTTGFESGECKKLALMGRFLVAEGLEPPTERI